MSFEIIQRIEYDLYFLYVHRDRMPEDLVKVVGLERDTLAAAILRFRDIVNSDQQFVIYKTLVGYQSIFQDAWERKDFDFAMDEDYRDDRIDELVESVEPENAEDWLATLKRCAQTKSKDLATFPSLGSFLRKLAARKPAIALGYLSHLDERLNGFLPAMLIGLSEGPRASDGVDLMRAWLTERRHVAAITHFLRVVKPVAPELVLIAMTAAIEIEDDWALLDTLHIANEYHSRVDGNLIGNFLLLAIQKLSNKKNYRWVAEMSYISSSGPLIAELTAVQVDQILTAMVGRSEIDYRDKVLLVKFAQRWPEKLLVFFERRLEHAKGGLRDYEAVPYQFHEAGALDGFAEILVDRAYNWYQADKSLYAYRGGRLVAAVYPSFSANLAAALVACIDVAEPDRIDFVVSVLQAYDGQSFLQPICREIVIRLPTDDPALNDIEAILSTTGVTSGEFGLVTAYQAKKQELATWLEDSHPAVQAFSRRYQLDLDRRIASEQRRSEAGHELRKRSWGDADDSSEPG